MASMQTQGSCVKSTRPDSSSWPVLKSIIRRRYVSVYHLAAANIDLDHGCIIFAKFICLDISLDQYPVCIKACLAPSGLMGKFMVRNTSRTSNSNSGDVLSSVFCIRRWLSGFIVLLINSPMAKHSRRRNIRSSASVVVVAVVVVDVSTVPRVRSTNFRASVPVRTAASVANHPPLTMDTIVAVVVLFAWQVNASVSSLIVLVDTYIQGHRFHRPPNCASWAKREAAIHRFRNGVANESSLAFVVVPSCKDCTSRDESMIR